MQTIKKELEERKTEIETYIQFLHRLEENESKIFSSLSDKEQLIDKTSVQTTSKAMMILLLYNLVESMLTKCLCKIHQVICDDSVVLYQLNDSIKRMILTYYASMIYKNGIPVKSSDYIFNLVEIIQKHKKIDVSYMTLSREFPLYSGNLDTRKIKKVLSKYGISFDECVDELQDIKNKRNSLAHGEESFEEVGRDISIQRINVLKERTFYCMEKVIENVEEFIVQQHYMKDESKNS